MTDKRQMITVATTAVITALLMLGSFAIGARLMTVQIQAAKEPETAVEYVYLPQIIHDGTERVVYRYQSDDGQPSIGIDEYELFCAVVMGECGNTEPDEGVAAVAECLLNYVRMHCMTVAEAIEAAGYSAPPLEPSLRVEAICHMVLFHELAPLGRADALWFYAPEYMTDGYSAWHEGQQYITTIGGHRFFR